MKARWIAAIVLLMFIVGCGGPKADVPIFMMSSGGVPGEVGDKLQGALQTKLGAAPTVQVITVPVFSMEKLMVEIAAGDNGILIIPLEQFQVLTKQGGAVSLDDLAKGETFPQGVQESTDNGKTEKHLYGIPLEGVKLFSELKLNGKDLIAFVPVNAKQKEKALQVMKLFAEK